jgi:hypothetical protein
VLIAADICAHGIWWVLTKEEKEAPARAGSWSGSPPRDLPHQPKPWSDRLSANLLADLHEWNDAWDVQDPDSEALDERGRQLAVRVQDELGTGGWEVLHKMGDRVYRVHPTGSWPMATWKEDLLGYQPRVPPPSEHPGRQQ